MTHGAVTWINHGCRDGKACDWFDSRSRLPASLHMDDNYKSFVEAMDCQFKTEKENHINLEKMKKVKYPGDVLAYIDNLRHLYLSGSAWRDILKNGLPEEVSYRLSLAQGDEPEEDGPFIASIKEHGLAHEWRLDEKSCELVQATPMTIPRML